jgi:hypothetical protein
MELHIFTELVGIQMLLIEHSGTAVARRQNGPETAKRNFPESSDHQGSANTGTAKCIKRSRRESSFTRVLHSQQRSRPERGPQFSERELRFTIFSTSPTPISDCTAMAYIRRCVGHSCKRAQRDSAFTLWDIYRDFLSVIQPSTSEFEIRTNSAKKNSQIRFNQNLAENLS